jgi:phosphate transport system permease protein
VTKSPEQDRLAYFLLHGGSGGNGSPHEPFATFEEALRAIGARTAPAHGANGAPAGLEIELACDRPDGATPRNGRPAYHFFVNSRATGSGGEGTAGAPWRGLPAALDCLAHAHQAGEISLEAGQRLRLSHREMFAASPFERWKELKERLAGLTFLTMTLLLVVPLVAIIGYLLYQAWPVMTPRFLWENPANNMTAGGIWTPLVGTFFLVFISLIVAAPVGILAGIYLNEYARDNWLTRIVNLAVMNLAGVPSIVHALFGVGAFVLFAGMGQSVLAASCTLAVMSLPVIITATREALGAVPMAFREACWNLGATRWQTIRTVVLPNSISGMLTGVIFEVSRAAGETAPILFTGAVIFVPPGDRGWDAFFPYSLGDPCMALSMHLFTLTTQVRNVPPEIEYGTALVLISVVLVVNSVSIALRGYLRSIKKW